MNEQSKDAQTSARRHLIRLERADALKWFAKDAPGWRFAALLVIKLPSLVFIIWLVMNHWK